MVVGSVREATQVALHQLCPLLCFYIMSFFDQVRTQDQSAPVTLMVNEESMELLPENYRNKTVSQLFAEYGARLGVDASRITRYVINSVQVAGDTVIRPGETVRGAVTSESKGSF